MRDAAGIITVQGDQLDWPYLEKWVNDLHLEEEWRAVCDAAKEGLA
jgi:hypothetical protein